VDSSEHKWSAKLQAATDEIESILKKYNLCCFYALTSKTQGCVRFSFREWSGMEWGIGEDGNPFTKVKVFMNVNLMQAMEKLDHSLMVSGYFQDVLAHHSDNMQVVLDDLNTCFNMDRNHFGKKPGNYSAPSKG